MSQDAPYPAGMPPGYRPYLSQLAELGRAPRPGALKFLAIASIVVAGASMLASVVTAGCALVAYASSKAAGAAVMRFAPETMPVSTPEQPVGLSMPAAVAVGERGLEPRDREVAVQAVGEKWQMGSGQAE